MSKTPEDIKKQIEAESIAAVENAFAKGTFTYPESYCDLYETGAYFALSLSLERIGELKKDNAKLKEHLEGEIGALQLIAKHFPQSVIDDQMGEDAIDLKPYKK